MGRELCYSVEETLLQCGRNFDTVWKKLWYSVEETLIQRGRNFVTVWKKLCYSVEETLIQCGRNFVTLWKKLCYSVEETLLQCGRNFVTAWKKLCYSVEETLIQRGRNSDSVEETLIQCGRNFVTVWKKLWYVHNHQCFVFKNYWSTEIPSRDNLAPYRNRTCFCPIPYKGEITIIHPYPPLVSQNDMTHFTGFHPSSWSPENQSHLLSRRFQTQKAQTNPKTNQLKICYRDTGRTRTSVIPLHDAVFLKALFFCRTLVSYIFFTSRQYQVCKNLAACICRKTDQLIW